MTKALAMKHYGMVVFGLFIAWNTLAAARTLYLTPVTYGSMPTAPIRSASIARLPHPETALRDLRIAHRSHAGDCSRLVCVAVVGALLGCAAGAVRDPPAADAEPEPGLRIATCALAGCRAPFGTRRLLSKRSGELEAERGLYLARAGIPRAAEVPQCRRVLCLHFS